MDEQKELETNSVTLESTTEPLPDIDVPTLRTYKGDISHTVTHDKITTAKILLAEQKKEERSQGIISETSIKRPTNILMTILSVIFILAGIGAIGYFGYTEVVKKTFSPITVPASFLFIFDKEKFIDGTKDKYEIYADVEKNIQELSTLKDGTYTDLVFYKSDPKTEEKKRITSADFFALYEINLPTNIARSISQDFVYGIYKIDGRLEPFLVVGLVDYENTFSSMFIWEQTLALDIKDLFPTLKNLFDITKRNIVTNQEIATTTASSTVVGTTTEIAVAQATTTSVATTTEIVTPEQQAEQEVEQREVINRTVRFIDLVFSNKDTRAVRDPKGTPIFYYAFINRDKILFAQDPKIVGEINRKIKEKSLIR